MILRSSFVIDPRPLVLAALLSCAIIINKFYFAFVILLTIIFSFRSAISWVLLNAGTRGTYLSIFFCLLGCALLLQFVKNDLQAVKLLVSMSVFGVAYIYFRSLQPVFIYISFGIILISDIAWARLALLITEGFLSVGHHRLLFYGVHLSGVLAALLSLLAWARGRAFLALFFCLMVLFSGGRTEIFALISAYLVYACQRCFGMNRFGSVISVFCSLMLVAVMYSFGVWSSYFQEGGYFAEAGGGLLDDSGRLGLWSYYFSLFMDNIFWGAHSSVLGGLSVGLEADTEAGSLYKAANFGLAYVLFSFLVIAFCWKLSREDKPYSLAVLVFGVVCDSGIFLFGNWYNGKGIAFVCVFSSILNWEYSRLKPRSS